jgi:hypothetical protein
VAARRIDGRPFARGGSTLANPQKVARARFVLAAISGLAAACGLEKPELPFTGTSSLSESSGATVPSVGTPPPSSSGIPAQNGISAPSIVGPLPGNSFADSRPTLTVRNATTDDGSKLTYDFQVASDDGFRTLVAETAGEAEGGGGTTSWRIEPALSPARYYWRARGASARGPGPYSPVSDFFITTNAAPTPPSAPSAAEIVDPLTNGRSAGEVTGGRFLASGWQVRSRGDFIRYVVPTIQSGFVEWENIGLAPTNPEPDLFTLFGMWDPSKGDYRENPYRVHLRKLDTQGHNPPYLRLRFISGGDQQDEGYDFLAWNPAQVYRWRIEWGPGGGRNEARVYLDGAVVIRASYGPAYRPDTHWIEMGVEERAESIVGIVYRNVRIGRR